MPMLTLYYRNPWVHAMRAGAYQRFPEVRKKIMPMLRVIMKIRELGNTIKIREIQGLKFTS